MKPRRLPSALMVAVATVRVLSRFKRRLSRIGAGSEAIASMYGCRRLRAGVGVAMLVIVAVIVSGCGGSGSAIVKPAVQKHHQDVQTHKQQLQKIKSGKAVFKTVCNTFEAKAGPLMDALTNQGNVNAFPQVGSASRSAYAQLQNAGLEASPVGDAIQKFSQVANDALAHGSSPPIGELNSLMQRIYASCTYYVS